MFDASFAIPLVAVVYVAATILLNRALGIRQRMKAIQKQTTDYQKALTEAMKKNDEKEMERLKLREKEHMSSMMELMWLPWKSLVFILPLFFLLIGTNGFLGLHFGGLLFDWFPGFVTVLPFGLHLHEIFSLQILAPSVYGARGYFIVSAVFAGFILEAVATRIESMMQPATGA